MTSTEEDFQQEPQEAAEAVKELLGGARALQWTGDNLEAVKELLGDAYEKTRGGLQEDDPITVWFWVDRSAPLTARTQVLGWAKPGDWIIRAGGGGGVFQSMSDKEFNNWLGDVGKE